MEIQENELVMVIPASLATGEPGDPLSPQVIELINKMVELQYWPLDFGEANDNCIELHFVKAYTRILARDNADVFIRAGGDV